MWRTMSPCSKRCCASMERNDGGSAFPPYAVSIEPARARNRWAMFDRIQPRKPSRWRLTNDSDCSLASKGGAKARSVPCTPHADEAFACIVVAVEGVAPERALNALLVLVAATAVGRHDKIDWGRAHNSITAPRDALASKQEDASWLVRHGSIMAEATMSANHPTRTLVGRVVRRSLATSRPIDAGP